MIERAGDKNIPQDGKQNIDQEISPTSALKEDTKRREDDGEDDLADIAGESQSCHFQRTARSCLQHTLL